jgi:hypothetical protein
VRKVKNRPMRYDMNSKAAANQVYGLTASL